MRRILAYCKTKEDHMGTITTAGLLFLLNTNLTPGQFTGTIIESKIDNKVQKIPYKECRINLNTNIDEPEVSMQIGSIVESSQHLIFDAEELGEDPEFTANIDHNQALVIKQDFSDSEITVKLDKTLTGNLVATFKSVGAGNELELTCTFKK